ncbi:MAG: DNA primase [Ruminococcaceae bacterium]|nr:DNA primase [Oscillospiraceae bacterium]
MARLPDDFIQQIRDHNEIESVISGYVELRRRGKTLTGLCPFHNEKTPSFTVYPETSSYYCFGCGAGGDVVTFIRNIENLDYIEAIKLLADRSGLKMPDAEYDDTASNLRRRVFEANRAAARFYHETLYKEDGKQQLSYLLNRGVSPAMIKHFGLGAAPDDWHALENALRAQGFRRDELVAANLLRFSEKDGKRYYYDAFRSKVMYPVIDLRGNVVAFGGRVLDNSKPKYINTSDTLVYKKSKELFALNFAKNGNERKLILCEGYMDVIALHQAGYTNAVAGLGTALTPEQVSLISRYADEVALCYDSDEAGQKAVRAAMSLFSKTGVKVKVIRLSGGKDPDEIIKTHGKEMFSKLLDKADNDTEYKLSKLREKYIVETDDGKLNFLREASKLLVYSDSIERDVYALRLADELGVSKDAILQQISQLARKENYRKSKTELQTAQKQVQALEMAADPQRAKNKRAAKAEDVLIITLLNNGAFYSKLKDRLSEDIFATPVNKRIFQLITTRLVNNEGVDISQLSQYLTSEEVSAVARLLAKQAMVSNTLSECYDCITVLEEEKTKREAPEPSQMSDESFLEFFNSLNKEKDV